MRDKKFYLTILLVFFCCFLVKAQSGEEVYVYKDSDINIEHSAEKLLPVTAQAVNEPDDDTIKINSYGIINDSAEVLKKSPDFAYAKNLDSILKQLQKKQLTEEKREPPTNSWLEVFFFSPITKFFFWGLACLFIGFILHRLFFTEGFFQRRTVSTNLTVLPDEDEHLSATTDYTKLIAQAFTSNNFRLAVRYHYLQTLQKLAAKGEIQFAVDKTNYQYVRELIDKPYKNQFARLTLIYEYAWYGGFATDEILFAAIQTNFKNFNDLV